MRWGLSITDTSKASIKARRAKASETALYIRELKKICGRALSFASPETVLLFAVRVELPRQDSIELEKLRDPTTDTGAVTTSQEGQTSSIGSDSVYPAPQPFTVDEAAEREIFLPRNQTYAARLEAFMDCFTGDEEAERANPYYHRPRACYPIAMGHLERLQASILGAAMFRNHLLRGIDDIKRILSCRENWYRMREADGDITMVMRSRGFGSPLVDTINIDEEWPEDESWGLVGLSKVQKKIYHRVTADRISPLVAAPMAHE